MIVEERKLVWKGAIPLQLQLHNSEITTVPPPPPSLILAPRNGYLPLLVPIIKPHFQSVLPIGQDTGWFEYEGLPLKWHIPTGVLFDLLCFEPTRPWNLTVHLRGLSSELLPYEGDDAMKWSFINSLKEASYVMYGSVKHVMNLSQADQTDLWRSVVQGDLESYDRICVRLAPPNGTTSSDTDLVTTKRQSVGEVASRVPFRLYVRTVYVGDTDHRSWDDISYISRPVDMWREDGSVLTLWEALQKIAPQLFVHTSELPNRDPSLPSPLLWDGGSLDMEKTNPDFDYIVHERIRTLHPRLRGQQANYLNGTIRIQGIEPSPDLPVDWIAHNLSGPDRFVHACVLIGSDQQNK